MKVYLAGVHHACLYATAQLHAGHLASLVTFIEWPHHFPSLETLNQRIKERANHEQANLPLRADPQPE